MKKLIIVALLLIPVFAFAEITKITEVDKIEVQSNGVMNVWTKTVITEDGQEISKTEKLTQYTPGQDVSETDQKVQNMAALVWTEDVIAQYEAAQQGTELTLEQQKSIKTKLLYANIKRFINTQSNGYPRYDDDLKLGIMNAIMTAIAAGQQPAAKVISAKNWLTTVQGLFVTKKVAIEAADDQSALDAVDVTIPTLESQYGRSGTVLADPGLSTADLVQ